MREERLVADFLQLMAAARFNILTKQVCGCRQMRDSLHAPWAAHHPVPPHTLPGCAGLFNNVE
jgi:hypothetical protein